MKPAPSREAARRSAAQEFPNVHKRPPLVPNLNHINPVHITSSYLSKINFNIIFPTTYSSS
jgi:hypothetical protein